MFCSTNTVLYAVFFGSDIVAIVLPIAIAAIGFLIESPALAFFGLIVALVVWGALLACATGVRINLGIEDYIKLVGEYIMVPWEYINQKISTIGKESNQKINKESNEKQDDVDTNTKEDSDKIDLKIGLTDDKKSITNYNGKISHKSQVSNYTNYETKPKNPFKIYPYGRDLIQ